MMAVATYAAFLIVGVALTVTVARILVRHGEVLMRDQAGGMDVAAGPAKRPRPANSVSRSALAGFYLVAIGAAMLFLRWGHAPATLTESVGFLGTRIGLLSVVLGATHVHCMSVMSRAALAVAAGIRPESAHPRRAKEDPMDRVFDVMLRDAPSGA